tara:strand:+ start:93 stop:617 length:525 start_codon:yes stop_codon:yes gene_type:complete
MENDFFDFSKNVNYTVPGVTDRSFKNYGLDYSGNSGNFNYNQKVDYDAGIDMKFKGGSGESDKGGFFQSPATKAGVNFLDNYLKNLDKERRTDPRTGEEKAKSPLAMAASSTQLASGLTEQRDPFYMMKTGGKFIPGSKGIGERLAGAAVGFAKGAITGQPHMAGLGAVTGFMG